MSLNSYIFFHFLVCLDSMGTQEERLLEGRTGGKNWKREDEALRSVKSVCGKQLRTTMWPLGSAIGKNCGFFHHLWLGLCPRSLFLLGRLLASSEENAYVVGA